MTDILSIQVEPPRNRLAVAEEPAEYVISSRSPKPFDYVQQEAANKSLGDAGESLIMVYGEDPASTGRQGSSGA
ncbi:MAG: hypothetical protein OXH68_04440 [Gammaproteobacteria bacterium]|nr:hypothetical protein [Gammaproteobacteria bacterium]